MKSIFLYLSALTFLFTGSVAQASLVYSVEQIGGPVPIVIGNNVEFGLFLRWDVVGGNAALPAQQPAGLDMVIGLNTRDGSAGIFASGITTLASATEGFSLGDFPGYEPFFATSFTTPLVFNDNVTRVEIGRLTMSTTGATAGTYEMTLSEFFAPNSDDVGILATAAGVPTYTLVVPEPSSLALLGCVAVGCAGLRRRRC